MQTQIGPRGCRALSETAGAKNRNLSLSFLGEAGAVSRAQGRGGCFGPGGQRVATNPQAAPVFHLLWCPLGYSSEMEAVTTTHAATHSKLTEESSRRVIAAANAWDFFGEAPVPQQPGLPASLQGGLAPRDWGLAWGLGYAAWSNANTARSRGACQRVGP